MKKLFKIEKYLEIDYELLKLLNIFKKVSEKKALRSKASKSKLSSRENKACISSKELYYFNINH